jgi:diguanylate cyclase (GGDEF)-like protein
VSESGRIPRTSGTAAPYGVKVGRRRVETLSVSRAPDETFDAVVSDALPSVAAGLALLSVVLNGPEVFDHGEGARLAGLALAVSAGVVCALVAVAVRLRPVPKRFSHAVTASVLLVGAGVSTAHMVLAGEARDSSDLMLLTVCAGAVLLSVRWLVGTLYLVWGAWMAGAILVGPKDAWTHYLLGMASATVVAFLVNRLRRHQTIDLHSARAEAEAAAVRDHLTSMANRRGLAMLGGQIVETSRRQGDAVHCIFVDIDGLKAVNDAAGHSAGDEVIIAVAEALRGATRATDVVARWGGDEFCVVGPGPGMSPLELERRIRDHVRAGTLPVAETVWPVRVSAGGAMLAPWDSGSLDSLLSKADQEMYLRRSLRRENPLPSRKPASTDPASTD